MCRETCPKNVARRVKYCLKGYNELECICVHKGLWTWSEMWTPNWSHKTLQNLVSANPFNLSYHSTLFIFSNISRLFSNISRAIVVSLLPQDFWTRNHLFGEYGSLTLSFFFFFFLTLYSWMIPCHFCFSILPSLKGLPG